MVKMDEFCTSELWNSDVTWNTPVPLFTSCFLKTVAIWTPVVFFWVFLPVEIAFITRSKESKLPWSSLNVTKLIVTLSLICTAIAEIVHYMELYSDGISIRPVLYYSPFIVLITLIAVLTTTLLHRKRGIITSGVLFLFWLLLALGTGLAYYNALQRVFNDGVAYDASFNKFEFFVTILYFPLAFVQLFLHCFADRRIKPSQLDPKEAPESHASFISCITFWWFNPMALLGYKSPLKMEDMWHLSEENSSVNLQRRLDKYWLPLVTVCFGQIQKMKAMLARRYSTPYVRYASEPDIKVKPEEAESLLNSLSILTPILKTFWLELLFTAFIEFMYTIIAFANPLILDYLLTFISSDEPVWKGFLYAGGMFFAAMVHSFFNSQYEFHIYKIAMQIRSGLTSTVYRKALSLSTSAKKNFTVGEIVNLMSIDIQRIMDYVQVFNILWSGPLEVAIALYLLWQQLGAATIGGLTVMILLVPVNIIMSYFIRKKQVELMAAKDRRTKLMNEMLGGIKVLKLYAWEPSFSEKIIRIRRKEIASLTTQAYLFGTIIFSFSCAPFLVSLASFATFVLISPENVLDANKAFVSLSLISILRVPITFFPMIVTSTAMFFVSLKRINKYLQADELDPNVVSHNSFEEDPVVIENGTFAWSKDDAPCLSDINLRVKKGSLVAVVGTVGCGKSSLLSALLGEMEKFNGTINVSGSVAYVPQFAWIQNATLRKNILFIKPYEAKKYKETIEVCALKPDLEILPGGDQTEIGEKGINLSGGQKQRVSLARAVYNDADIYFFDDPLSAVDAHVGKHIFEKVIGPKGVLKKKTRILVTHRITVLPEVDTIVVLKDGKISEVGSYHELLSKKEAFAEFLIQFLQENAEKDEILDEDLSLIEQIAAAVGAPPELRTQLSYVGEGGSEMGMQNVSLSRSGSILLPSGGLRQRTESKREDSIEKLRRRESMKPEVAGTKLTEKEASEVGSVKWSVYFEYIKAFGYWGFFVTTICYVASTSFGLGTNLWLTAWSNDALDHANANNIPLRNTRLGVYGALGAGETIFSLATSIVPMLATIRAARILHDAMLTHIFRAPMSFFDTTPMGRILNRFSKDIDTVDVTIRFNIRMIFVSGFRTLSAFIIMSLETPIFLVAIVPLAILYYFMQKVYIPTSRQLKRLESVTRSPIYAHFSESVTGATSIRAYSADKQFVQQNNNLVDINNSAYYPSLVATRWLTVRLEFIGYCIVFLAALFSVLFRSTLSPGIAGLTVSYALEITGILNNLVKSTADIETNIVSVERCLEYTKTPTEASWENEDKKPNDDWPDQGVINFDGYSTRYREGLDLVLKNISCNITSKERIGIVGRTGAGKSSLTLALFRIIESATGNIVIDNINIADLGLHDLRRKLTIIPQDPVLFTGTLRMNLDPFDFYPDAELWIALELAHLKPFVKSLEKGLLHDIVEEGENLSVGQRQLVCLARALLRKTKVLILDEATAAVDVETDEVIQKTIRTAFSDSTVFTIAHRLNTIIDYDRVMVLSQGEIVELDSPKALLENEDSIFYAMAKDAGLV